MLRLEADFGLFDGVCLVNFYHLRDYPWLDLRNLICDTSNFIGSFSPISLTGLHGTVVHLELGNHSCCLML